jgi:SAM-dependent methyltransferase
MLEKSFVKLGDLIPDFLKSYVKLLYHRRIAAMAPIRPAGVPRWLYGLEITRTVEAPRSSTGRGLYADAFHYYPSGFRSLPYIRAVLHADDVFVDLGSGLGEVVLYIAGTCRIRKAVGIELDPELVRIARKSLHKMQSEGRILTPVELIEGDVVDADLSEGTTYFLFNPFGEATLHKVLANIRLSLGTNPRRVRILYLNPKFASCIDENDWLKATDHHPRWIPDSLYSKTLFRIWSSLNL